MSTLRLDHTVGLTEMGHREISVLHTASGQDLECPADAVHEEEAGRQPLLAIDDVGRLECLTEGGPDGLIAGGQEDKRARVMPTVGAQHVKVLPEVLELSLLPGIGALIVGDHEQAVGHSRLQADFLLVGHVRILSVCGRVLEPSVAMI